MEIEITAETFAECIESVIGKDEEIAKVFLDCFEKNKEQKQ